jgi:putative CocE/NonD family hydrolase
MHRYLPSFLLAVLVTADLTTADYRAPGAEPYSYSSRYLTMRDGVRVAVDVYLPTSLAPGTRLPTILHQTRYFRAHDVRWFATPFFHGVLEPRIARYVARGYAYVVIDTRGSGASFGTRSQEFAPDELRDAYEIADWIVAQPWSSGVIGAVGGSYEGAATEFLASTGHSAVKAIIPQNCLFDAYTDMAFPGGVPFSRFLRMWGPATAAMDRNDVGSMLGLVARAGYLGVRPVQGDSGDALLRAAIAEHAKNYNVASVIGNVTFKDETNEVEAMSLYPRAARTRASPAAIYSYDGWYDAALMEGAIKRFLTVSKPGNRLRLGPWNHKGKNLSPFASRLDDFDHTEEELRFFDHYLKGIDNGIDREPPVHYYTVGEERWHTATSWPPRSRPITLFLGDRGTLAPSAPAHSASDRYAVDTTTRSGPVSRWMSLLGPWDLANASIPDRTGRDKNLPTYVAAPVDHDIEITGHPLVTLHLASTHPDGTIFVYLEDVDSTGAVHYVTEGLLRLLHRKLSDAIPPYVQPTPFRSFGRADALSLAPGEVAEARFALLPISYLFRRGHSIRVAISGADADQFDQVVRGSPVLDLYRGGTTASRIELPAIERR